MKNDRTNEDTGVYDRLIALDDSSHKAVKKLTKDKSLATLGFLNDKPLMKPKNSTKKL